MRYALLAAVLVCVLLQGCGGGLVGKWEQQARVGLVTVQFLSDGHLKIDAPGSQDYAAYKVKGDEITITRLGAGGSENTYPFKLEGDTLTIKGFYGDGDYHRVKK
jgi:hypothetical protein